MTARHEVDAAALMAIKSALKLPEGDLVAVSVLAVYRTQCEHEAREEERERVLDALYEWCRDINNSAKPFVPDGHRSRTVDLDDLYAFIKRLRGEP